jgi:drug/metabolite transporter (DMT)-like permease
MSSTRATGIALAFVAALISGVAIFVNGHAVKHFGDATVYTTAKNAVAGLLLLALAWPLLSFHAPSEARLPRARNQKLGVLAIAVVGGSVPFVLFFEGLARAEATQAAFIQKTLVVWVAILAVPLLRERLGILQVLAIGLLVVGQAWLVGEAGTVVFGSGEVLILAATLLWAVEVVVARRLLGSIDSRMLAAARMALGTVILLGWVAVSGKGDELLSLSGDQWGWALLTGLILTGYVATWYAALARAQAVDVTAVLVFGAVVTAVLSRMADGVAFDLGGVILVTAGAILVVLGARRRPEPEPLPA